MELPNFFKNLDLFGKNKITALQNDLNVLKASRGFSKNYLNVPNPVRENFRIDPHLIKEKYLSDNYMRACVLKKVDKIMSGGYYIDLEDDSSEGESQKAQFEEFEKTAGGTMEEQGEQINFTRVLRKVCLSLVQGDDFYLELELPQNLDGTPIIDEIPKALHVQDWEDMVININVDGTLVDLKVDYNGNRIDGAYKQVWNGELKAIFDKHEIIHANYYGEGTRSYGLSRLSSVIRAVASKEFAEKCNNDIFKSQKPRGQFEIDADDEEFEKIKKQILDGVKDPNTDLFFQAGQSKSGEGPVVKWTPLVSPKDMPYAEHIKAAREDIPVGIGVPGVSIFAATKESGWEAQTKLHEFDEDINGIRDFLENIINNQLFPKYGWTAIKFKFNKVNKRDERNEATVAVMLSPFMTMNEIRTKLGLREVVGGDTITPVKPSGFGGQTGSEETGDQEPTQEMAQSLFMMPDGEVLKKNMIYDFPIVYKSKSDTRKIKTKGKPPIGEQKPAVFNKIFQFRTQYTKSLNSIFNSYLNKVEELLRSKGNVRKTADLPGMEEIDKLINDAIAQATSITNGIVSSSYEFGNERAAIDTGIVTATSSVDLETLEFLEKHNINLVEGAFSDIAKDTRTQIRLGLQSQESIPKIIKRLKGVDGLESTYKKRFENIARTETNRAVSEGTISGYEKSGVINKVEILIGADPEGSCTERFAGKTFTLNEAHGLLPNHSRCTCGLLPIIE